MRRPTILGKGRAEAELKRPAASPMRGNLRRSMIHGQLFGQRNASSGEPHFGVLRLSHALCVLVLAASMGRKELYLVRHGETDWNVAGRWQGHTDIPLNAHGRLQARVVAAALRSTPLAGLVSSDLSRARETAEIIATVLGVKVVSFDPNLRERAFGPFEGLTGDECLRLHPEAWRAWRQTQVTPPGAEDRPTLAARVVLGLRRVAEDVARGDAAALVVTHGGALRAAVAEVLGTQPPPVANGAIWRVVWDTRIVSAEEVDPGG